MKRRLFSLFLAVACVLSFCITAAALTSADAQARSALTYTVSFQTEGEGDLYWNYGKNMEFFAAGESTYNKKCLAADKEPHRFPVITERSIIVKPKKGWYFDGFFDSTGRHVLLPKMRVDLIRIRRKGVTYYDYIPSADNPEYSGYPREAYREIMKTMVKALYGTRVYKTVGHEVLYKIPKKNCAYRPVFRKLQKPEFPDSTTVTRNLSDPDFYIAPSLKVDGIQYKSSSSKVIKVDPKTGSAAVCGPGTAVVTIKIPESDTKLSAVFRVKVNILPVPVTNVSASRAGDRKYVTITWQGNHLYSGYEIQISGKNTFRTLSASKTAASGKTKSTKVRTAKSDVCKFARIRPYKKSGGQKIYGPYTVCRIW